MKPNLLFYKQLSAIVCLTSTILATSLASAYGGGSSGNGPSAQYAANGSFSTTSESGGSNCTIYRPRTLSANHPVIIWGNGTGASPSGYASGLRHWASYGFVVAAANTSNAGTGKEMLNCLDYLTAQHNLSSGTYAGKLNLSKVGASGHSQGGGGTIMAGRDSRIKATVPFQPYTIGLGHQTSSQSQQKGPMLLLSGSSDTIATPNANQAPVFSRANVPVFWATLNGASHFEPANNFGDFSGISTAWFLWHLKGDQNAGALFSGTCSMCNTSGWNNQRKGL